MWYMKSRLTVVLLLIVAAIAVASIFLVPRIGGRSGSSDDSAGLFIGGNAIYVAEQNVDKKVLVSLVRLKRNGFVVIREDAGKAPGAVLGTSDLLPAGETRDLPPIVLSRVMIEGETLYAALYFDDGDGVFELSKDAPALDAAGGEPTMTIFTVSRNAGEPGAISL